MEDTDQKLELHQHFWRHRRNCGRCSGRNSQNSWAYQNSNCVLDNHIVRRKPTKETKQQTKPSKPLKKKPVNEAAMLAKGLVKISYTVDDDFDAVAMQATQSHIRTIWIEDYSDLEADVIDNGEANVVDLAELKAEVEEALQNAEQEGN
ncbi:hypothetical protein B0A52_00088 [Exophiala mesophila]|uniref:Uncharacterized protein n=1 Tax=Exophiala mesophila TaxID=212818 RepID=A0A438NJ47_EXOME|nr:hypothetical protein B0A52_00088 [Exophiala mesophila]